MECGCPGMHGQVADRTIQGHGRLFGPGEHPARGRGQFRPVPGGRRGDESLGRQPCHQLLHHGASRTGRAGAADDLVGQKIAEGAAQDIRNPVGPEQLVERAVLLPLGIEMPLEQRALGLGQSLVGVSIQVAFLKGQGSLASGDGGGFQARPLFGQEDLFDAGVLGSVSRRRRMTQAWPRLRKARRSASGLCMARAFSWKVPVARLGTPPRRPSPWPG